jgi:hypothetical protein
LQEGFQKQGGRYQMHEEEIQANLPAFPPGRRHQQGRRPDELLYFGRESRVACSGIDMESGANLADFHMSALHNIIESGGEKRVGFVGSWFENLRVVDLT